MSSFPPDHTIQPAVIGLTTTSLHSLSKNSPQTLHLIIGTVSTAVAVASCLVLWALCSHIRRNLSKPDPLLPSYVRHSVCGGREKVPRHLMIPQLLNLGRPVKENTWLSRLQEKLVKQHERCQIRKNDEWLDRIKTMVDDEQTPRKSSRSNSFKTIVRCKRGSNSHPISVSLASHRPLSPFFSPSKVACTNRQLVHATYTKSYAPHGSNPSTLNASSDSPQPSMASWDWELEYLRNTDHLFVSGQPIPWTTYIPSYHLPGQTDDATLKAPAPCIIKDSIVSSPAAKS